MSNQSKKVDTLTIMNFLMKYKTQESITSLVELEGLLVGWSCSPSSNAQDLLDHIFGAEEPETESVEEVETFLKAVFECYNLSSKEIRKKKYVPLFLKKPEELSSWCRYFTFGIGGPPLDPDTIPEHVMFYLLCIFTKALPEDTKGLNQEPKAIEVDQKTLASLSVEDFADMAREIHLFACEQRSRNRTTKQKMPGRNDPCLCGSGKKFKKCCLQ